MRPTEAVREGAPDPEDAERRLHLIEEAAQSAAVSLPLTGVALEVLVLCCQRAPYLARLLARDPARLDRVSQDPYQGRAKPIVQQRLELDALLADIDPDDNAGFSTALRIFRADELVRCGVRELALEKPIEVGEELAHLADVCLDAAIIFLGAQLTAIHGPPRYLNDSGVWCDAELAVIAMGKHGGEELNFASDIDIIYVYTSDAGDDSSPVTLHQYFTDLCRQVSSALGEVTDKDVVFRVDLRLRPEGSRGAIANSLPSLERYYESWGRPWERQAWLKARACAGSATLGEEIIATMRPFVFPRHSSVNPIAEVFSLNQRIKAEHTMGSIEAGYDVKNGIGGIREIEFFVQALQLIWSPSMPALRTRSTVGALDQLLFSGIITEAERQSLGVAYRFMRHVEHLLQLDSGRQTQRLPSDDAARNRFAKRLGFDDVSAFDSTLTEHAQVVAELFASLADDEERPPPVIEALLAGRLSAAREKDVFASLGFTSPEQAHAQLERVRRLASSPLGLTASGAAGRVAPMIIREVSSCPDPDQAFDYFAELAARRSSIASIWTLMADAPALLRLLASLFGTSQFLSRQFVKHPEFLDQLLSAGASRSRVSFDDLAATLDEAIAREEVDDEERRWNAIAEFKTGNMLRIGLADIAGEMSAVHVCTELSILADVCLTRAFGLACSAMRRRYGWPVDPSGDEIGFSVLAMGKLGASELGYASDLDVVFVYSGEGSSTGRKQLDAVTFFTRLAQRLLRGLHAQHQDGRLYELDTRLRPLGSKGLLVSSLDAWRHYHKQRARLWERQALTKLRAVAGDETLGAAVTGASEDFVYAGELQATAVAAGIREMRLRIEKELAPGPTGALDLKVGPGGLVDIEFVAQFLQLVHGPVHTALRARKTVAVLETAAELELANASDLQLLADGYRFLRFIEHRMRIVHDRSVAALPSRGLELDKLARRAGYARAEALLDQVQGWQTDIRAAFLSVLGTVADIG